MRNIPNVKIERYRFMGPLRSNNGAFKIDCYKGPTRCDLQVIASDGGGWDHVSVTLPNRCPTWEEMDYVKSLFFKDDETVMQLHPARSLWINNHPTCLHLWRPQTAEEIVAVKSEWGDEWPYEGDVPIPGAIPLPPPWMIGIKGVQPDEARADPAGMMKRGHEMAERDFKSVGE